MVIKISYKDGTKEIVRNVIGIELGVEMAEYTFRVPHSITKKLGAKCICIHSIASVEILESTSCLA